MADSATSELSPRSDPLDAYSAAVVGAVERVGPAVVSVYVGSAAEAEQARGGAGSGVVVTPDGYLLTNEHVVSRDGLKGTPSYTIVVERPALRRIPARVRFEGEVPAEDLAILEIGESLPAVSIGQPLDAQVGDDVVVIGAPYGRSLSVSSGCARSNARITASPRSRDCTKSGPLMGSAPR